MYLGSYSSKLEEFFWVANFQGHPSIWTRIMELFPRIEITARLLSERPVVPVLRKVQTSPLSPCKKHPSTAKTWPFLDMELRQEISRGCVLNKLVFFQSPGFPTPRIMVSRGTAWRGSCIKKKTPAFQTAFSFFGSVYPQTGWSFCRLAAAAHKTGLSAF